MRFKIDWASHIVGSKFTVFALLYFVFEGNFPSTSPRGAYIWRGDLTEGFLRYRFGGLIFGGAFFRNFTVYCLPEAFFAGLQIVCSRKAKSPTTCKSTLSVGSTKTHHKPQFKLLGVDIT